jgi:cytochrome c oxidase assembly protein subunit 15
MSTYTAIVALWLYSRRLPLPKNARLALNSLLAVGSAQVTLGISTLLLLVPVPLAAAHQSGSLTLLTVAMWLMSALKRIPK